MPSWFQLGTRKLARGIFSPGFWRSQRPFILGGASHRGTQPANAGLTGSRATGQAGFGAGSGVREEKGHISEAGGRGTMPARAAEAWLPYSGCFWRLEGFYGRCGRYGREGRPG